jgi:hypothetical protein
MVAHPWPELSGNHKTLRRLCLDCIFTSENPTEINFAVESIPSLVLELGRAAAKKGLVITPILAAGEKFFARNIMSHRTSSTLANQFYST